MRQAHPVTNASAENNKAAPQSASNTRLIYLTTPTAADAAEMHKLVSVCKPLDLNSTYAYLLLCHHYADTCVIARMGQDTVGFISAYRLPQNPQTLFIWQVAVHPDARGARLGARMLQHLLKRKSNAATCFLETTVSPSNEASRRMFQRLADSIAAPINEQMLFDRAAFGDEDHEEEVLLKIGPFDTAAPRKEMQ